jgi:hypothetical protein
MARFRAVQLGRVIDMDPAIAGYWGALQCVLTGQLIIADFGLPIADCKEPQQ